MTDGVIVVDKPAGMTSHDVVDEVRRRLGIRRVGHGGTLDPAATGVLLVGVGRVTRLLSFAQRAPKRYLAIALFGTSTTTQDAGGEVVERRPTDHLTQELVEAAMKGLQGELSQVPPMMSALKVGGERLHVKARRGEQVEREPRRVTVYRFGLVEWRAGPPPTADFDVYCSAGTYVRTLIHDLGAELGCGAHVTALRRVAAGGFQETEAIPLDDITAEHVRPALDAVRDLEVIEVDDEQARAVRHGRPLEAPGAGSEGASIALAHEGDLLAVYRRRGTALVPDRVLA